MQLTGDIYPHFFRHSNNKIRYTVTFSDRLVQYRRSQGLTQAELARKLGVSTNYVGILENGKAVDENSSLYRLFEIFESRTIGGPRAKIKAARNAAGMTQAQLAKAMGFQIGVLQAVEDGSARITEKMAKALVKALPELSEEELLYGSDQTGTSRVEEGPALIQTVGTDPSKHVVIEPGMTARYVPLISWAQAGTMVSFDDDAYQYEGHLAFNVKDPKAISVQIRGQSMSPKYDEGDVVILYPSYPPVNGDLVVARLSDEAGSDVMFKVFHEDRAEKRVTLTSYNPAFPPLNFNRTDFAWIFPVAQVVTNLRK